MTNKQRDEIMQGIHRVMRKLIHDSDAFKRYCLDARALGFELLVSLQVGLFTPQEFQRHDPNCPNHPQALAIDEPKKFEVTELPDWMKGMRISLEDTSQPPANRLDENGDAVPIPGSSIERSTVTPPPAEEIGQTLPGGSPIDELFMPENDETIKNFLRLNDRAMKRPRLLDKKITDAIDKELQGPEKSFGEVRRVDIDRREAILNHPNLSRSDRPMTDFKTEPPAPPMAANIDPGYHHHVTSHQNSETIAVYSYDSYEAALADYNRLEREYPRVRHSISGKVCHGDCPKPTQRDWSLPVQDSTGDTRDLA